jgi:Zn-dependent protease
MENIYYAIEWVIIFIISATLHEGAHALAAKKGGDLTAYASGRVSLNPLVHIARQPLGMLVFPFISSLIMGWPFGYASIPYNPIWAYNNPRKAAWMAASGPAANLLLVISCGIAIKIGLNAGFFLAPNSIGLTSIVDAANGRILTGLATFLSMMFSLNLIMLALNLIPLPPLDGSSIVSLFLPMNAARNYWSIVTKPAFGFAGLLIAWQIIDPMIKFAFPWAINLLYWGAKFA